MNSIPSPERVLSLPANARPESIPEGIRLTRLSGQTLTLEFEPGQAFLLRQEAGGWFVLPALSEPAVLTGDTLAWVLPLSLADPAPAWLVKAPPGSPLNLRITQQSIQVEVQADALELTRYANRPRADVFGQRFSFAIPDGPQLEEALSAFYWDTLLPCVVERTVATHFPTPDGYVLSTLAPDSYFGTYPDVDHEFQVKGRLAMGSLLDEDVVRRMLELQFKVMREDPQGLWRNPCAIQADGTREYHVRRNSWDHSTNALMFLITGNVEVLEEAWHYVAATKDRAWLAASIQDLEGAASCIEACIDPYGRLWSDVYFEDQVMQDGRVCDAQAFAVNGFRCLAELEQLLGREPQAAAYRQRAAQLAAPLAESLPRGYWDPARNRFTNWVDRNGDAHDHVHLLSNEMPLLFGCAQADQSTAVLRLVDENQADFQRFPSFVALDLAGYTESEMGTGGPYDLCAAGRYWCWDAAFWAWRGDRSRLHSQLTQVAREGAKDGYRMGERYDMDHVYYVDGQNWHGAAHYYEYPCVFTWVLVHEYLGLAFDLEADLSITPRLQSWGKVELGARRYALRYACSPDQFSLSNLADTPRSFRVDLSVLYPGAAFTLRQAGQSQSFTSGSLVLLQPGEECQFLVSR